MGVYIEAAAYSSIGGRKNNEDNFYLNGAYMEREQMNAGGKLTQHNRKSVQIYGVFDGMGGGEFGEQASALAVKRLKIYQESCAHVAHGENLRAFLQETSESINQISIDNGLKSGACGSTAAMLLVEDSWYRTAHVGDSRVYRLREGMLKRLTKDQSEVQRLVDAGTITQDEAWSHPRKNVITHHLGMPLRNGVLKSIISDRERMLPGDIFLICSDGVSDSLRDQEIEDQIQEEMGAAEIVRTVARMAMRHAKNMHVESDNVTAIVLKVHKTAQIDADDRRLRKTLLMQKLTAVMSILFGAGMIGAAVKFISCLGK